MLSMLNFAYWPCIVNSLLVFDNKGSSQIGKHMYVMPKLCLNAAIYFLNQTFKILAEHGVKLLRLITIALFTNTSYDNSRVVNGMPTYIKNIIHINFKEYREHEYQQSQRNDLTYTTASFYKYLLYNYDAK